MQRVILLAILLLVPLAHGQEKESDIPPWPYRKVAWKAHLLGRLREVRLTLTVRDWTLQKLLGELTRSTRITCRADKTLDTQQVRTSLVVQKTHSLRWILDRMTHGKPWSWVLSKGDVVLTRTPERYPPPDPQAIRRQIQDARFLPTIFATLSASQRRNKSLIAAVATDKINHAALSMSANSYLASLKQMTGLPIKIQPGLKLSGKIERPAARQVSLATMLAETLDPLGLSYTSHRGNLWIGNADFTALQKKLAEQSRQVLAAALEERAKLLGRAVNTTFEDMPMHQLGDRLSRAIGMPVRIGPKAWKLAKPVTLRTKGMTLGEFGRWLSQQLDGKITLIVAEETVYLVSD